jgi:hypothetical protein
MNSRLHLLFAICLFLVSPRISIAYEGENHQSKTSRPHADHNPKHGGQFFMAPNKWNHLEGTMPSSKEFRLYFYDNYTKPISAKPFLEGTTIDVDRMENGMEVNKPVRVALSANPQGKYLTAILPEALKLPLYYIVNIQFPKQNQPDLFNFIFAELSKEQTAQPAKKGESMEKTSSKNMYQCPMQDSPRQEKPGKCPKCGMNLEPVKK